MIKTPAETLRSARAAAGFKSAAEAAKHHDWKVSTYTSHENGTREISKAAARRYARAFRLNEGVLLGFGGGAADVGGERVIHVIGETAVGLWRDISLEASEEPRATIRLPDIGKSGRRRQAVRAADNSANRAIPEGEYAIWEPLAPDEIGDLPIGSMVVIDRIRGSLRERTLRRVRDKSGSKIELACHSTEKRFAESISYPSTKSGEKIEIIGRIVGKYAEFN